MAFYKIHNKSNGRDLTYPSIGMWNSSDLQETREIRDALKGYLAAGGMDFINEDIVIVDIDTDEEIE